MEVREAVSYETKNSKCKLVLNFVTEVNLLRKLMFLLTFLNSLKDDKTLFSKKYIFWYIAHSAIICGKVLKTIYASYVHKARYGS